MSYVPDDIVKMLAAGPGKYAVSSDPNMDYYVMVEVDAKGRVYQLNPKGERDGILSNDGWTQDRVVKVFTVREVPGGKEFIRIAHPDPLIHKGN